MQNVVKAIAKLLASFPPSTTAAPDEMARIYLEVVRPFHEQDILEAVMRFVHGKDSRPKKEFAPTPSILADEIRKCEGRRFEELQRDRLARRQIEEREQIVEKTPESRKRVLEMAKQFRLSNIPEQSAYWAKTTPEAAQQWLDERKR